MSENKKDTVVLEQTSVNDDSGNMIQTLKKVSTNHPALNRLRAKVVSESALESVITSYDRMHHRHNRS